jgi:hypothetical protein
METEKMAEVSTIEKLLTRNLFEVFGERDLARRQAAIKELYAEGSVFSNPHGRHLGHEALDGAIASLDERLPDYVFKNMSAPQSLQDSGRLAWSFGPPEEPERVTGLDVIVVRGDRIAALYTFLDKPPA